MSMTSSYPKGCVEEDQQSFHEPESSNGLEPFGHLEAVVRSLN